MVVCIEISAQNLLGILIVDLLRNTLLNYEIIVVEVADEVPDLACVYEVLSWFCLISAEVENSGEVISVLQKRSNLRLEFLRPAQYEVCQLICRNFQKNIL